MRLRLNILRHKLPPISLLWTVPASKPQTIAQLLEDVNHIVPLEAETWGLEDYILELGGFECLHFSNVAELLKDDDEVCIRPLQTAEVRSRTIAGRYQISAGGQHLVDGIPFGRPYLRQPNRPAVHIPSRKRLRQITVAGNVGIEDENTTDGAVAPGADGTIPADWKLVALREVEGDDSDSSPEDAAGLTKSVGKGNKVVQFADQDMSDDSESDEDFNPGAFDRVSDDSMGEASDEDSDEDSDASSASESGSSDIDSDSDSSSDSGSSSDSSSDSGSSSGPSEYEILPQSSKTASSQNASSTNASSKKASNSHEKRSPAGRGLSRTRHRNERRRIKHRLTQLKSAGILPPQATLNEYREWVAKQEDPDAEFGKSKKVARQAVSKEKQRKHGGARNPFNLYSGEAQTFPDTAQATAGEGSSTAGLAEDEEIRRRKLALLNVIQSGTIEIAPGTEQIRPQKRKAEQPEVPATDGAQPPGASAGTSSTHEAHATPPPATEPTPKRARLDISVSRRLLLGSLGLRVPKTKEDADKLRAKLDAANKPKHTRAQEEDSYLPELKDPDAWKSRIRLSAFECWDEDVELTAPPFPFRKNWDQPSQEMEQPKTSNRKQKQREKQKKRRAGSENGTVQLNYDEVDEVTAADADQALQAQVREDADDSESGDDLPPLPSDLSSLPKLSSNDVKVGNVIVFKVLECSAQTNWSPNLSGLKTAKIEELTEASTIKLRLAKRDQPRSKKRYDAKGNRVYEKYDAIEVDEEEYEGPKDVLYEEYANLVDARLLQAAEQSPQADSRSSETLAVEPVDGIDNEGGIPAANEVASTAPDMMLVEG
jgi:hypothetical protein